MSDKILEPAPIKMPETPTEWAKIWAGAKSATVTIVFAITAVQVSQIWAPEFTSHTATLVACVGLVIVSFFRLRKMKLYVSNLREEVREIEIHLDYEIAKNKEVREIYASFAPRDRGKKKSSRRRDDEDEDAPVFTLGEPII